MNVNLPPDLHLEVRRIRNIEVWRSDLLPLIVGRQKIPSIPINAFGAQLQDLVLDLYKMASGNRYGSVKTANTVEELKYLSVKVYLPLMVICTSLDFR